MLEEIVDGLVGNTETGHRVDNNVVAPRLEVVDVNVGGLAELGHVGKQERTALRTVALQRLSDDLELFSSVQTWKMNGKGEVRKRYGSRIIPSGKIISAPASM